MVRSINDARFTMWATVVPGLTAIDGAPDMTEISIVGKGAYKVVQDDDSGELVTIYDPTASAGDTPGKASDGGPYNIRCYARAYTALGYRSSANRETYIAQDYNQVESIQLDYPKHVVLGRQTLITNLRGAERMGVKDFWLDAATGKPTVWEVQGTSPVHDPFGKFIRNTTVLKRAEVQ